MIENATYEEARDQMFAWFDREWGFQYDDAQWHKGGVSQEEKWNLKRLYPGRCDKCHHGEHSPGECHENVGTGYYGPVLCREHTLTPGCWCNPAVEQVEGLPLQVRIVLAITDSSVSWAYISDDPDAEPGPMMTTRDALLDALGMTLDEVFAEANRLRGGDS